MDVDGVPPPGPSDIPFEEDTPTCKFSVRFLVACELMAEADTSIEAPPSLLPARKYCDITGLEVRIHSVSVSNSAERDSGKLYRPSHWVALSRQERLPIDQRLGKYSRDPFHHDANSRRVSEHGCSARLPSGARCEPYREIVHPLSDVGEMVIVEGRSYIVHHTIEKYT
jgi:hypothetical protein